jgi:hypothetical protein
MDFRDFFGGGGFGGGGGPPQQREPVDNESYCEFIVQPYLSRAACC